MFEFLGHHQPDATDEAVAQSCAHSVKIDALSNSSQGRLDTERMVRSGEKNRSLKMRDTTYSFEIYRSFQIGKNIIIDHNFCMPTVYFQTNTNVLQRVIRSIDAIE